MADTKISDDPAAGALAGTEIVPVVTGGANKRTTASAIGALQPTIATATILGNNTGSTARPVALTATQVKTLLSIAAADVFGLGSLATASTVSSAQITDGTIVNADINAGAAVALSKLATIATARIIGNVSGSSAAPGELTAAQVKTLLDVASGDISDFTEATQDVLGALAGGGSGLTLTYNDGAGTWVLDVNVDGSSLEISTDTLRIKDAGVTLAKMANIGANTIIGNNTGSSGVPVALTTAQTKAILAITSGDLSDFTTAVHSTMEAQSTKTTAYTIVSADGTILADATSGAFSVTLPTAVGRTGQRKTLKKIDSGTNAVTLATTSSQTIDGATTRVLSLQRDWITVESDGANWQIVAATAGPRASVIDLSLAPYNVTTATADISSIVATASSNTNGNAILKLPAGTFNWTGTCSTFRFLQLEGAGVNRTIINYTSTANPAIQVAGGVVGTATTATANIAAGARTITVAATTGMAVGSILNIRSSKDWEPSVVSGKGGKYGELVRIYSISGLVVTLTGPTKWAYATADSPVVEIQSMSQGPVIKDMTWRNTTPDTGTNTAIRMRRCVDAKFERLRFEYADGPAIEGGFLVWGLTAHDITFMDGSEQFGSGRYSYGFNMANASRDWTITSCRQRGGRHMFTTNADGSGGYGIPYSARIVGCTGAGSYEAMFDTHHEGADITFEACVAESTRAFCFQIRAPRTRVLNCTVLGGSGVGLIARDCASGSDIQNFHVSGLVHSSAATGARGVWLQNLDGPVTVSGLVAQDIYGALVYIEGTSGDDSGHVISDVHGVRVATGEDNGAIEFKSTATSADHVIRNVHLTDIGGSGNAVYGPSTITNVTGLGRTGVTTVAGGMSVTDIGSGGGLSAIANNRVLGNVSGSSAVPTALTAAQVKTMLAIATGDVSGLGSLASLSAVGSAQITDDSIVDADVNSTAAIALSKLATIATDRLVGNVSGSTAVPTVVTPAQVKTLLALASTDISDFTEATQDILGALASGGAALTMTYNDVSNTWTLDVNVDNSTLEVSTDTLRVKDSGVTLAKMANIAASTWLANNTGSAAAPIAITNAQAKTLLALVSTDVTDFTEATQDVMGSSMTGSGGVTVSYSDASNLVTVTIGNSAITLAKIASIANNTILGNVSGSTGAVAALTASQVKTAIAITGADVSSATFAGNVSAPAVSASGLTGATSASRYVGATSTGPPSSGTFVIGDYVIARDGGFHICTTAGSPGTWTSLASSGSFVALTGTQSIAGDKTFTNPTAHTVSSTDTTPWNRAIDLALQNTSSTNLNYMTFGHYAADGTIADGLAFQTINHTTHLGRVIVSTRTAGGFAARLTIDDTVTVATGTVLAAPLVQNAQTGTTYTLALTDLSKLVELSNASAITLTVPPNSSVAFPIGSEIHLLQTGAGQVTVAPGAAVTVNATPGLKLANQWSAGTLIKRATNTWVLIGDLSA